MSKHRYLTGKEVQAMIFRRFVTGPNGEPELCLILLAYRHGMRISELPDLHYQDLDLNEGRINIRRLKNEDFLPFTRYVLMSVKPWNDGARNVLTGRRLTGLTLYLFLAAGVALSRQQAYRIIRDAGIENALEP
ncbi:tyrosine-type recombinase/integrase [Escherichia coli]|nr:tyrosine-type recombinase/integrase [Escherichia coli]